MVQQQCCFCGHTQVFELQQLRDAAVTHCSCRLCVLGVIQWSLLSVNQYGSVGSSSLGHVRP